MYSDGYAVDIGSHVFPMTKFALIKEELLRRGAAVPEDFVEPVPATMGDALLVHTPKYVEKLMHGGLSPMEEAVLEVPYSQELVDAAFLWTGGTIAACRSALERGVGVNVAGGFHHAHPDHGEGFCVLNDVAIGVARTLEDGIGRVAVVDCDVHQGNGTAFAFAKDSRVFTVSLHQQHNYPSLKPPSNVDVGLEDGAGGDVYLPKLADALETTLAFAPELVVYVAGADPYEKDLLGGLALTQSDLAARDAAVLSAFCGARIPIVIVLAGGYARRVSDTVAIHATTIERAIAAGEAL